MARPYCRIVESPPEPPPRWSRREVGLWSLGLGCLIGLAVAGVIGIALESWQDAESTRLRLAAVQAVNADLAECKRIAMDLGQMEGATDYAQLQSLARSVWAAQEGRQ